MEILEIQNNIELILSLKGRLDTLTSSDLDEKINNINKEIETLILDLSELDYISSAGLRILSKSQKIMSEKNGRMIIKNVNTAVMSVLKMTGFNTILTIE